MHKAVLFPVRIIGIRITEENIGIKSVQKFKQLIRTDLRCGQTLFYLFLGHMSMSIRIHFGNIAEWKIKINVSFDPSVFITCHIIFDPGIQIKKKIFADIISGFFSAITKHPYVFTHIRNKFLILTQSPEILFHSKGSLKCIHSLRIKTGIHLHIVFHTCKRKR